MMMRLAVQWPSGVTARQIHESGFPQVLDAPVGDGILFEIPLSGALGRWWRRLRRLPDVGQRIDVGAGALHGYFLSSQWPRV